MATVVRRSDFQVIPSAHTPAFPVADYVINPASLAALVSGNIPKRYWKDVGSDVVEMTPTEKTAIDTGPLLVTVRQEHRRDLFDSAASYLEGRYRADVRGILLSLMVQGQGTFPARQAHIKTYLDWLETLMAEVVVRRNAINSAASVPVVLAVSLDFSLFDGTDPGVNVFNTMAITT